MQVIQSKTSTPDKKLRDKTLIPDEVAKYSIQKPTPHEVGKYSEISHRTKLQTKQIQISTIMLLTPQNYNL
jgi:hypothetical protein